MSLLTDKGEAELRRTLGEKEPQQGRNKRGEQHTVELPWQVRTAAGSYHLTCDVKAVLSRTESLVETKR